MRPGATHPTTADIHLDRLAHNLRLLREAAGGRPLWPAIKANAYGHGAEIVARELLALGCETLCVAHVAEAVDLVEAGVAATFVVLTPTLPEHAETIVEHGFEPVICTHETARALARAGERAKRRVAAHLMVDTGMGRVGIRPQDAVPFLESCGARPFLHVRGLMSHFPRADEADKSFSLRQIASFNEVIKATADFAIEVRHMANSAAILDLPDSHLDAVRPGIALYGLPPSHEIVNPRVSELRPVLEWKTRIVFLKEVPAGTGLSYGHTFHTEAPSLIATIPVGYGDGLSRRLSNLMEVLIRGVRCPQVGRITMDQCLVDVTALSAQVELGDEAVLIGRQGQEEASADDLAARIGTINYEIVTAIRRRVPRVAVSP